VDTSERGRRAECRAVAHLRALGYAIVERNYRCALGEIDVVAREGGDLVFVEVRSRADAAHGDAALAVDGPKRRRVARVAEHYLGERTLAFSTCRFDVVAITGDEIVVFRDAFRVGI
jgi:putative endonuclease